MLADLACAVASLLVLLTCIALEPDRAACPPAFHLEAVRPSGSYLCRPNPAPEVNRVNLRGGYVDASSDTPDIQLAGHIYCTGGSHPIVVTDRVVGCTR